ncbi:MAG TPA: paraquat-inducible protein A [Usitatibacter sp.]|nr:paraquat-inducible protein A [Usitatibacter sp.]
MPYPTSPLVACPQCDALQLEPALVPGGSADCVRCGAELYRHKPRSIDRTLAFLLAAAILFLFANLYPLMEMDARGLRSATTLFGTVRALSEQGMPSVGVLVFATALALPVLELAAMIYMLLPLRLGFVPAGLRFAFRLVERVRVWGMVEVLLLGALIAFVKLNDIAVVHPGIALYALAGFVFLLAAADAWYEPRAIWHCARELAS